MLPVEWVASNFLARYCFLTFYCDPYFLFNFKFLHLFLVGLVIYLLILYLGKNELLGDVLCLIAALFNGVIMVAEDHIVKCRTVVEYLGMLGIFGLITSSVQM